MVIQIRFNFSICVKCAEKAISKITFNIRWNVGKSGVCGPPEYQRVTSKGSRRIGPEWPDKGDKTGFSSVARGVCGWVGGGCSHGHPHQVKGVDSGVVWVTGLFSLWYILQSYGYCNYIATCCNYTATNLWLGRDLIVIGRDVTIIISRPIFCNAIDLNYIATNYN